MGKILLEGKNLLTEKISESTRDKAVTDFCDMHCSAIAADDEFFALEELYGDNDAPIYRYFESWHKFIRKEYGAGVSMNAWQTIQQIFLQTPNIKLIPSICDFFHQEKPLAVGGFRSPDSDEDLLVDIATWRKWREAWFCTHQKLVDWKGKEKNCFFVNDDAIGDVLSVENKKFIEEELNKQKIDVTSVSIDKFFNDKTECHIDGNLSKGLKDNAVAIFFHSFVMSMHPEGGDRQGYAYCIGSRICKSNYYRELTDLATMEKAAAPKGWDNTQRAIFGIVNSDSIWKFISIDFEKGMFEFYDNNGEHLGEFRFDGSINEKPHKDHNLRCVDAWKKKNQH